MIARRVQTHRPRESQPVHVSLEALFSDACSQTWLAVDMSQSIVSLFRAGQSARICCHQLLPPNALRVLIPLVLFPESCPYSFLLAALRVPEQTLLTLITESQSSALVQPFFDEVERMNELLELAVPGSQREQHLRHLRRIMTDTMAACRQLGLTIVSLRRVGYRLQPTILPKAACQRRVQTRKREIPIA